MEDARWKISLCVSSVINNILFRLSLVNLYVYIFRVNISDVMPHTDLKFSSVKGFSLYSIR